LEVYLLIYYSNN